MRYTAARSSSFWLSKHACSAAATTRPSCASVHPSSRTHTSASLKSRIDMNSLTVPPAFFVTSSSLSWPLGGAEAVSVAAAGSSGRRSATSSMPGKSTLSSCMRAFAA